MNTTELARVAEAPELTRNDLVVLALGEGVVLRLMAGGLNQHHTELVVDDASGSRVIARSRMTPGTEVQLLQLGVSLVTAGL